MSLCGESQDVKCVWKQAQVMTTPYPSGYVGYHNSVSHNARSSTQSRSQNNGIIFYLMELYTYFRVN